MDARPEDTGGTRRLWPAALVIAAFAAVWWLRVQPEERPRTPVSDRGTSAESTENRVGPNAAIARSPGPDSPERDRVEVAAATPNGLVVTVLDPDDAPVPGVLVELTARLVGSGSSGGQFARAETDARGVAVLVAEPDKLRTLDQLGVDLDFEVSADVPLTDPPRAKIGNDPRTAEPVVLRVAGFGEADVRVIGPDGAAIDDGGPVYLFWRTPGSDGRWEREGIPSARSAGGGRARFWIVPLDRELLFRATGAGRFASGEATAIGPTRAGESVDVTIRLGPALPFVVGRLVDESGVPLADVKVSLGIGSVPRDAPPDALPERNWIAWRWHTTDAEGGFRTVVHATRVADRRRVFAVEQDDSRRAGGGEIVRRALVPLEFELRGGSDNDLGTVALVPDGEERVLVSGIVVDGHGEPLANANVSAGFWDRDAGKWQSLHRNRVRTGHDGRFEIRSTAEAPATFQVSASARKRVSASVDATMGARDLELVLQRGGTLNAWIRAPDGVPAYQLVGRIGSGEPNQFAGHFGYDNLRPGRHDVTVRIRSTSWEIARVPGVVVPEGGVADDPRLDGIEVACRPLRLVVLDADGAPMEGARLWLEDRNGRGGSCEADEDGRVLRAVPSATDVFFVHDGQKNFAELTWRADEQTVRLLPR